MFSLYPLDDEESLYEPKDDPGNCATAIPTRAMLLITVGIASVATLLACVWCCRRRRHRKAYTCLSIPAKPKAPTLARSGPKLSVAKPPRFTASHP